MEDIYCLWVVAALGGLLAVTSCHSLWTSLLAMAGFGGLMVSTLPLLAERRKRLVQYLLFSYLQLFTFGDPGEVTDREAF